MRDIIAITYDPTSGAPELTAAEWRQIDAGLYVQDTNGLVYPGVRGGAVSNVGSAVTIAPLTAVVQTNSGLGAYRGAFPAGAAELAKTIAPAGAQARVDALDVKVYDHEADGSTLRGMDIVLTTGTAGSGSAPSPTGVSVRLGTFTVPASGGGNPAFTPSPALVGYAGAGGVLSVAQRPANPVHGLEIFNRSTSVREIYIQGSGWRNLVSVPWLAYTTTWSSPGGSLTIGSGIKQAKWQDLGNKAEFKIYMQRAADSNVGDGIFTWTLPTPAADYPSECGPGFYRRASAPSVTVPIMWAMVNSNGIGAFRCSDGARLGTGSFTGAAGDEWVLRGSYEKPQT